ncbi:unnamed protein product [Leptidea sinapis]|uniref:Uncharacterized protein n=1 Tax=Leptidea sinapis TaxID=189913 RepID=A0A5E4PYL3_9NEOP|nr:unnamed protein product [Leptidea sinapis]
MATKNPNTNLTCGVRRLRQSQRWLNNGHTSVILVLVISVSLVNCNINRTDDEVNRINSEIPKRLQLVEAISGRGFIGNLYENGTFRTGNNLWDNILNKCTLKPSVSCLQKNFYSYLDESLDFSDDVNVTSAVCFKKNNVDMKKYSKEANIIYLTGKTPLEEVTDALYKKGVNFLMTHDMKVTLPEVMFHGASLKISPRALTKSGALIHVDLEPKETQSVGRFFHKIMVKLIALKLIFVLPVILGVTTAKKMFLKLLLFIFPALSHIFKLCSWYHQNYHTTKFHHHHHLITHHHKPTHYHHPPPPVYGPPHGAVIVKPHVESHGPSFEHYPQDWELSGPGLGNEDSSELLPPADSKMALNYYRYVQAARDGQEQKDCLSLYPNCNIDYNKK